MLGVGGGKGRRAAESPDVTEDWSQSWALSYFPRVARTK